MAACMQEPQQLTGSDTETTMAPVASNPVIKIIRQVSLPEIPSASGIEIAADGTIYIIGDDSPYLYQLDAAFDSMDSILLFKTAAFTTGRIPKTQKPDLECISQLLIDGQPHLLAMGSGSLPNRDSCYIIPLPVQAGNPGIKVVSLRNFYRFLSKAPDMAGAGTLNLEGLATNGNLMYMLHRYAAGGQNKLITVNLDQFRNLLTKNSPRQPNLKIYTFQLDQLDNVQAGFSGAHVADGKLFFTASVEKTPNAIDDGEIAGSFAGWIDLADITGPKNGNNPVKAPAAHMARIEFANGSPFTGKAESICVLPGKPNETYRALAVTDNDQGQSELLVLEIKP
jgi:hypothetical protein